MHHRINLAISREDDRPRREAAPHQVQALRDMHQWTTTPVNEPRGAIVVLPTGGGKTFTAVRFLCTDALSRGSKVLWLAHTHHLLEQAVASFGSKEGRDSFADEAAWIAEPKAHLDLIVVSGADGHARMHEVRPEHDVLVCTLPSAARAMRDAHPALLAFLQAARDQLVVVFDEAHHAPAPTYARLMKALRERVPGLALLGLTATPHYADQNRRGWLPRLFPQGIIHQSRTSELMASGILARPFFEHVPTAVAPRFSERDFAKWANGYRDLPDAVITELAENSARNDLIADTYTRNREKYGRTIVFADRWIQCDYLREAFRKRGVAADVVYSHQTTDTSGSESRNRRSADDNSQVLHAFRDGQLDVLINVRMLTEGTDVPSVQSVFLTRQTTSPVLLTQMIGRALRGPKFGGTREARIVSFVDDWTVPITWADPVGKLEGGGADTTETTHAERAPIQLLSIELVRAFSRELSSVSTSAATTYLSHMPVGWYRAEYDARQDGSEDIEQRTPLVMVTDVLRPAYERFVTHLTSAVRTTELEQLQTDDLTLDEVRDLLMHWATVGCGDDVPDQSRLIDLLHLARHIAQNGMAPHFFEFSQREEHDLDALAQRSIEQNQGPTATRDALRLEFDRADRFWRALYPTFDLFWRHFLLSQQRLLSANDAPTAPRSSRAASVTTTPAAPREPDDAIKRAVRARDGHRCLCCGSTKRLQTDHVMPSYLGGPHTLENLQTLCASCNNNKNVNEFNFRRHTSPLNEPQPFILQTIPKSLDAGEMEEWQQFVRRSVNFLYQCAAVEDVHTPRSGPNSGHWKVRLYPGNDARWMRAASRRELCDQIADDRMEHGLRGPYSITVEGVSSRVRTRTS
jgi:ATP-dependent helicase IRC3